ncbi:hypothetical protein BS329_15400 [Amycolatopsis coloradensis]|uniref:Uncharacterized protein n=1 Tax=Amycolatopsis coloradensis TaxID=76021 RepID=A0A1R0KU71_9PSEU|nr:hypothetical protein [Amycolatopsis coloradensis]OLZ51650.1 hypothetical protein BS329_15400 [Amycolatopsis coloradensis]
MTLYFHLDDEQPEERHPFIVRLGRLTFRLRRCRATDLHGSSVTTTPERQSRDDHPAEQVPVLLSSTADASTAVLNGPDTWQAPGLAAAELAARSGMRHSEPARLPTRREESIEHLNL